MHVLSSEIKSFGPVAEDSSPLGLCATAQVAVRQKDIGLDGDARAQAAAVLGEMILAEMDQHTSYQFGLYRTREQAMADAEIARRAG
jgi:hypothetical protein